MNLPIRLVRIWLCTGLLVAGASAQSPFRTIALSGQHAGGTVGVANYASFFPPVINAAGEVAFHGALTGADVNSTTSRGIWRSEAGALSLIARSGAPAPGTEAGSTIALLNGLSFNTAGQVGFSGFLLNAAQTQSSTGLFVGGSTPVELVARTGAAAPGAGAGAVFSITINPLLNEQGQAAFLSVLSGPGITSGVNNHALYVGLPGSLQIAARTGELAPGTTQNFVNFDPLIYQPALNDSGVIALKAHTTSATGLWKGTPGALGLVALTGQPAPGAGSTYRTFDAVKLNDAGRAAFIGTTNGAPVNGAPVSGIWAETSSGTALVALEGAPAPGTPDGVRHSDLRSPAFSDNGAVAFTGELFGTGVVEFVNDEALWTGMPGALQLLARAGNVAPGVTDGAVFRSFAFPHLNGLGQVAFVASLLGPNENGIWATTLDGRLALVVRQGDLFDVGGGLFKTVSFATLAPGDFTAEGRALSSPFNDASQLAFRASFTDGSSGLFVATVPEPATALLLLIGGWSLGARRRPRACAEESA